MAAAYRGQAAPSTRASARAGGTHQGQAVRRQRACGRRRPTLQRRGACAREQSRDGQRHSPIVARLGRGGGVPAAATGRLAAAPCNGGGASRHSACACPRWGVSPCFWRPLAAPVWGARRRLPRPRLWRRPSVRWGHSPSSTAGSSVTRLGGVIGCAGRASAPIPFGLGVSGVDGVMRAPFDSRSEPRPELVEGSGRTEQTFSASTHPATPAARVSPHRAASSWRSTRPFESQAPASPALVTAAGSTAAARCPGSCHTARRWPTR